ncbi:DUF948 domain-containing protein [Paenibacillus herberti]|uniref:DUF948 domain-containing protein n=1 Tax=Paenibacillus herberti TaxID=1619309 RepID=A0A229NTI6_9BACL|nr:DUF948 domain-containing protein [Paenibacillus herberti]OXM13168.1 hypothetical protein CGZ75_23700 [Paenibacillus herberti]
MDTVIAISVLIIAISIAVLVVFLVQTLRKAQQSMEAASGAIREVQGAIKEWKGDVDALVISVKDLTNQVNHQIDAVDPLMASVREVGTTVHEVAAAAREFSSGWTNRLRRKAHESAVATELKTEGIKASLPAVGADSLSSSAVGTAVPLRAGAAAPGQPPQKIPVVAEEPAGAPAWVGWLDVGIQAARLIRSSRSKV